MTIADIVEELDAEIARLEEARKLLSSTSSLAMDGVVRGGSASAKQVRRKKRTLSPEARKRIADAQRKRWAAQKAKR
ncbi:MAG TPA: hypothetical protein VGI45_05765 [Terracidiphilus sp.]|jgi:hypothetical protein